MTHLNKFIPSNNPCRCQDFAIVFPGEYALQHLSLHDPWPLPNTSLPLMLQYSSSLRCSSHSSWMKLTRGMAIKVFTYWARPSPLTTQGCLSGRTLSLHSLTSMDLNFAHAVGAHSFWPMTCSSHKLWHVYLHTSFLQAWWVSHKVWEIILMSNVYHWVLPWHSISAFSYRANRLTDSSVPSAREYSKVTPREKSSSRVLKALLSLMWNLSPVCSMVIFRLSWAASFLLTMLMPVDTTMQADAIKIMPDHC